MIYDFLVKTADIIGISGVILLLIAYFLLSTNRMSSQSLSYQLYNLIGALCILYSLLFTFNLSSVVIETCWIIISLIGIYRIQTARYKLNSEVPNTINICDAKKNKI